MISAKQLSYLQHMGIDVWRRRDGIFSPKEQVTTVNLTSTPEQSINKAPAALTPGALAQSTQGGEKSATTDTTYIKALSEQPFVRDLCLALHVDLADLKGDENLVHIGDIEWRMRDSAAIEYQDKVLSTPLLATLQSSWQLKKQLWQSLSQHR